MFDQFTDVLKTLGIDPALAGVGVLLAIALRYARGMFHAITSEWTYALAVVFGVFGAWLKSEGLGARGAASNALALTCIVIVFQKVLEKAAEKFPFLPSDNEWTKK